MPNIVVMWILNIRLQSKDPGWLTDIRLECDNCYIASLAFNGTLIKCACGMILKL